MKKKHNLEDIDLTIKSTIEKIELPDIKNSFFNKIKKDHNERMDILRDKEKNERRKNRLVRLQLAFFPLLITISVTGGLFNIYTFINNLTPTSSQEKTPPPKEEKATELSKPYTSSSHQKKVLVLKDSTDVNNTEKTILILDKKELKKE